MPALYPLGDSTPFHSLQAMVQYKHFEKRNPLTYQVLYILLGI